MHITVDLARYIVRDMHRSGLITAGERSDAMDEIARGRGAAVVARLRRAVAG